MKELFKQFTLLPIPVQLIAFTLIITFIAFVVGFLSDVDPTSKKLDDDDK